MPNYERRAKAIQYQAPLPPLDSMRYTQVPADFELQLFASEPDVVKPIWVAWDERGRAWVVEARDYPHGLVKEGEPGQAAIKICEDTNGDDQANGGQPGDQRRSRPQEAGAFTPGRQRSHPRPVGPGRPRFARQGHASGGASEQGSRSSAQCHPGAASEDLILRDQIQGEALLRPSDGDRVTVRGKELVWKRVTASTNHFDFNAVLKSQNDHVAGYMVTYVECDQEIPNVMMSVASSDQARIYFNGVDIYASTEARPLMLDADKGRITLKKGINVLVFKIINVQNSWQGAMRLTDRSGSPLKGVKIRATP